MKKKGHNFKIIIGTVAAILCVVIMFGTFFLPQVIEASVLEWKENDADYQAVQKGIRGREIDTEGNSTKVEATPTPTPVPNGSIRVTFVDNKFLDISYFTDESLVQRIDTEFCYLNPGDCIYASEPVCSSNYSSVYFFSEFRIFEYLKNNEKNKVYWTKNESKPNLVCQIPENYEGTQLSVMPVGEYTDRELTLDDYFVDVNGTEHKLLGTWKINNKNHSVEKLAISPLISYQVSYHYDAEYYYVSSTPEAFFWQDATEKENGVVTFETMSADSDIVDFSVELKKYVTAVINDDKKGIDSVTINNKTVSFGDAKEILLSQLKPGDVVRIVTKNNFNLSSSQIKLQVNSEPETGNYVYTFLVPEDKESLNLYVKEWQKKKLALSISTTEEFQPLEYIRIGNKSYNFDELKWKSTLEVREDEKVKICLTNNIPDNIEVQLRVGTDTLTKVASNSTEFVMEYAYDQINEIRITPIKKANTSYPMNLKVSIDKSMENACVSVGSELLNQLDYTYSKAFGWDNVCNANAGTAKDVSISIENISMEQEKEIKMEITKVRTDGTNEKDIRYIKGTVVNETIAVYDGKAYYKSIEVKISKAVVEEYSTSVVPHATVKVSQVENGKLLNAGDVLEADSKVLLVIQPEDKYYISGKITLVNGRYEKELLFSELETAISNFNKNHPVKPYVNVILDREDYYGHGTISFFVNGKETTLVMVKLKLDDTLEMKYVIPKDSEYQIVKTTWTDVQWIINAEGKKVSIQVAPALEGSYIKVTDYFTVEKKEE